LHSETGEILVLMKKFSKNEGAKGIIHFKLLGTSIAFALSKRIKGLLNITPAIFNYGFFYIKLVITPPPIE